MSAPIEVWTWEDGSGSEAGFGMSKGKTVRYLRADLTCGECDWERAECRHPEVVENDDPACMAFVPKEGKG